jgi:NADH-quinone oxidoreductase subunit J
MSSSLHPLFSLAQATTQPLAEAGVPMAPAVMMSLCAIAGIGTYLLLPGRREASLRKVGAVVLLAAALIFAALLVRWTAGTARGGMGAYFWVFSAVAIVGAVRVITHTKPVYSALYFVLTVFATAGLFLLLWAEFMAAALVLIYAGAILVTYVFVIMLAAQATTAGTSTEADHDVNSREPLAASVVGFVLMGVLLFAIFDKYQSIAPVADSAPSGIVTGSTQQLGEFLFRRHVVSLELAGLILTIAMVGAILIARRQVIVFRDSQDTLIEVKPEVVSGVATPVDDDPHSIPVEGTRNPRQKAYPET